MIKRREEAGGFQYATVAYTRPDIFFLAPVPPPPLLPRTVYVAGALGDSFYDYFALGTREVIFALLDSLTHLRQRRCAPCGPLTNEACSTRTSPKLCWSLTC